MAVKFRQHPLALKVLRLSNKFVVIIMYFAYVAILFWLGLNRPTTLWKFIVVPGVSFIILSLARSLINEARPYEEWHIDPLIVRNKKGDSMPSRHVFSATMIAMCALWLNVYLGTFLLILAVVAAVTRVIGGVHFSRDVFVGMVCGIIAGLVLFIV